MANPTGTTNLTENTGYTWTDGDVYEIVQTDQQEGAALGASFGGLGVDNEPHQVLLNKAKLLRTNQVIDEANIANLLNFKSFFVSLMSSAGGYLKLAAQDVNYGAIQPIIQWGNFIYNQSIGTSDTPVTINWAIPFPNALIAAIGVATRDPNRDPHDWELQFITGTPTTGTWEFDNHAGTNVVPYGFNWLAIGF